MSHGATPYARHPQTVAPCRLPENVGDLPRRVAVEEPGRAVEVRPHGGGERALRVEGAFVQDLGRRVGQHVPADGAERM